MTISEQRPELHNLVHLHSNLVKINRSADQLSSNQLATLSLEISKSSINYENRIAALVVEKNLLNSVARHLWRDYDNAIAPYHRVDNQFVQIYDQLIKIRDELVKIDTSGLTSDKFGSVREIADRLVTLESTHCANGVFFNDKTVPSLEGQDILTALLNRNFMTIDDLLTRKPSSCEFLGALSSKLARIIRSLETLKSEFLFPDIENTVHTTTEIKMILEHLNDLEKMKKNGLFLKEGAAYPDQEYIHDMMENARGLVASFNLDSNLYCVQQLYY